MKNMKTMKLYEVYSLDMYKNGDEGLVENGRCFLGWSFATSGKDRLDDKAILLAMARFRYEDASGREVAVMSSRVDRRMVYAQDLYETEQWWEVGYVKGHVPLFGLKLVQQAETQPVGECSSGIHIESYNADDIRVCHDFSSVQDLLQDWNSEDPCMGDNEVCCVVMDGVVLYAADKRGESYERSFRTSNLVYALELLDRAYLFGRCGGKRKVSGTSKRAEVSCAQNTQVFRRQAPVSTAPQPPQHGMLTTGTIFKAKCDLYEYRYRFIGVDLSSGGYILLENLDTHSSTVVEPEWFRLRTIVLEEVSA